MLLQRSRNLSRWSLRPSATTTTRHFGDKLSEEDEEYNEVLQQLFKAAKTASRHNPSHSGDKSSTPSSDGKNPAPVPVPVPVLSSSNTIAAEELFSKRKTYFQSLARSSQMDACKLIHVA
jgi:hypothetical protein